MSVPSLQAYASLVARRPPGPAPRVSIITVCLDAAATLERCIASVQAQSFADLEHVLVDGGSRDGTVDLVRRRLRPRDYWISERDAGISDAFNKGLALARGAYVQFLNADDWMEPDQVARAVSALERTGADYVFGDLLFYQDDRPTFRLCGDGHYARCIDRRMPNLNHPTLLARRDCFVRIGLFDPDWRCAMDYDWLLRLHRAGGRGHYEPGILGHMTHDGVSNRQFRRTIDEVCRIAIRHGRPPLLARAEAGCRLAKTLLAQPVKSAAFPVYQRLRALINRSYLPI